MTSALLNALDLALWKFLKLLVNIVYVSVNVIWDRFMYIQETEMEFKMMVVDRLMVCYQWWSEVTIVWECLYVLVTKPHLIWSL